MDSKSQNYNHNHNQSARVEENAHFEETEAYTNNVS